MNYDFHITPRDPVDAFIASLGPSSREGALAIQRRYKQLLSDFARALQETNDRELARYCTDVSSQIHRALSEWRGLVRLATKHAERMPAGKPKGVVVEEFDAVAVLPRSVTLTLESRGERPSDATIGLAKCLADAYGGDEAACLDGLALLARTAGGAK